MWVPGSWIRHGVATWQHCMLWATNSMSLARLLATGRSYPARYDEPAVTARRSCAEASHPLGSRLCTALSVPDAHASPGCAVSMSALHVRGFGTVAGGIGWARQCRPRGGGGSEQRSPSSQFCRTQIMHAVVAGGLKTLKLKSAAVVDIHCKATIDSRFDRIYLILLIPHCTC